MTHQFVPLLYIIESINTNVKVSHEDEDLNPKQKADCKEVINGLMYFLPTITDISDFYEMACPESACIFQGVSNIGSPECGKVLNLTEGSMVIQLADIPLQLYFHHIEAGKQDLPVMDWGVYEELMIGAPA